MTPATPIGTQRFTVAAALVTCHTSVTKASSFLIQRNLVPTISQLLEHFVPINETFGSS